MLVVNVEHLDGTDQEHRFECAKEDSMARAGVEPSARMVIEMIDEDEEE